MFSKIIAYLLLYYLVYKTSLPPNPSPKLTKIKKFSLSEILLVYFLPYPFIILWSLCTLCYIYIMYQQEHNNVVIINVRFSEWSFYDIVFYILNIFGCFIRLWCFRTLKEFFTFNVTILKNHRLIDTGPYALVIHPSYTGVILMTLNVQYMIYQLHYYIPIYSPVDFSPFIFNWYYYTLFIFLYVYLGTQRILNEENLLKQKFGREWDLYSKKRKRFIPYLI